ncbi:hypothetical protein N7474_003415 [Penicillium riverlandense]|uniref:uncharacterized protein n=1 Tax=Penicillium riverlandense TaxID=1903569 RepID=UPI0025497DD8|nr:uncharacterized protein N7474_003415 [Penicillium riverlandense]KAJ5826277.1 hypothetical protein N7474_003415 [Penicillium riverlandense]
MIALAGAQRQGCTGDVVCRCKGSLSSGFTFISGQSPLHRDASKVLAFFLILMTNGDSYPEERDTG